MPIFSALILILTLSIKALDISLDITEETESEAEDIFVPEENLETLIPYIEYRFDKNTLFIDVMQDGNAVFCGLMMIIEYDDSVFSFTGAKVSEDLSNFGFKYNNVDGGIAFLLDSGENCSGECKRIASFCFSFKRNRYGEFSFALSPYGTTPACKLYGGKILNIPVNSTEKIITLNADNAIPSVSCPDVMIEDNLLILHATMDHCRGFSTGFELFFVDLDTQESEKMLITRATCPSYLEDGNYAFNESVPLPQSKNYCLIVRAFVSFRSGNQFSIKKIYYSKE